MTMSYTHRDGRLRMYDGSNPKKYLELGFVKVGMSGPEGRPFDPQKPITDRGRISTQAHYQSGNDDNKLMAVAGPTFAFILTNTDPNWKKWRQAMNLPQDTVWTVGLDTWVSNKGQHNITSGGETPVTVSTPTFSNSPTQHRTVDIEVLWNDPSQGSGVGDIGVRWTEVEFEPDKQKRTEQDDGVEVSASGQFYGPVEQIIAFSAGTSS